MHRIFYHWKLRSKMMLLFIIIIMFCSGIILSLTTVLYTVFIKNKTETLYSSSLNLISQNTSNYFDDLKNMVYAISYSNFAIEFLNSVPSKTTSSYSKSAKQLRSSLKNIEAIYPNTRVMFISEMQDEVYHTFDTSEYNFSYDFKTENWFSVLSDPHSPSVTIIHNQQNYLQSPKPDDTYAVVYKITNWASYNTTGYMLIQLDKSVLSSLILSEHVISEDVLIYDHNTSDVIYDNREDSSRWTNTLQSIRAQTPAPKSGTLNTRISETDCIAVYCSLPDLNWTFVFSSPYSSLLSGISVLLGVGVLSTLVILVIAIVSVRYFTSRITKPLEEMNQDIELMKQNNFQFQLPVLSNDEIGELTQNFNAMVVRMDFLVNKSKHAMLLLKQAELDALQQQINPHFLYNTLEMIVGLASQGKSEEVIETCGQLGQIFKFNLSSKDFITVENEVLHVKNYLAIIQKRFEDKIQAVYEIEPSILPLMVIKFILQPFVENAVVHGFQNLVSGGILKICMLRLGEVLSISVEDNGEGVSEEVIQEIEQAVEAFDPTEHNHLPLSSHIGILNVCFRLKLLFDQDFSVSIRRLNPGTGIYLEIPYRLPEQSLPAPLPAPLNE